VRVSANTKIRAAGGKKRCPSIIGRMCAFESKIVFDSRFMILVTRCEKRR